MISPEKLLHAYASGVFPMADHRHDKHYKWYSAAQRGIIPINQFHVSHNVQRIVRNHYYHIKFDTDFRKVIEACADRETTWISDEIIGSYCNLYELGHAHSVSVYDKDWMLVGGQYGVSLKAAYFGESMFERAKEASKVALFWTHQALKHGGFCLWDTQFWNQHLAQFGCIEISSEKYKGKLTEALAKDATFREVAITKE